MTETRWTDDHESREPLKSLSALVPWDELIELSTEQRKQREKAEFPSAATGLATPKETGTDA